MTSQSFSVSFASFSLSLCLYVFISRRKGDSRKSTRNVGRTETEKKKKKRGRIQTGQIATLMPTGTPKPLDTESKLNLQT